LTIRNLQAAIDSAPAAATSYTVTVLDNGAPTALGCTIANPPLAVTTCSDTTDSVNVAAGHWLQVRVTETPSSGVSDRDYMVSFTGG
jgi:hypothetical protein